MNKYYEYRKQHSNINRPPSSLYSLSGFLTCPQTYPLYLPTIRRCTVLQYRLHNRTVVRIDTMNKYYAYIKQHSNINRPQSILHSLPAHKHNLPAHKHTHFTCPQTYQLYLPTDIPTLPVHKQTHLPAQKHTHFTRRQTYPLYLPTDIPTSPAHRHTHFTCPQTYPLYLSTNFIPTLSAHKHTHFIYQQTTHFNSPQKYPL